MFFITSKHIIKPNIILKLLANKDRYNFFVELHRAMENNLSEEDKRLFYNYLSSCKEKLQNKKDYYNLFTRREKHLIGIIIFGIIASATVLTINLLKIYAALWFFWFGIVGAILTVAVGIRLFLCIKEKLDDLKKLKLELKQENKTVEDKIAKIDHAMEVYDLNKIKNFKEPKIEKISTLDVNEKKTILSNNVINANEKNNNPELGQNNPEPNINSL